MLKACTKTLSEVFALGVFEPAKIQREYQWRTDQVSQLIDDLVAAFQRMGRDPGELESDEDVPAADEESDDGEEPAASAGATIIQRRLRSALVPDTYFLGGLIVLTTARSSSLQVYDGLQRLVTLSAMLCAIRDTWPEPLDRDLARISTLLFDPQKKRRLQYPTPGRTLASLISGETLARSPLAPADIRLRDTYHFACGQFNGRWLPARRRAFLDFLAEAVHVSVSETDNHSVAYQMFMGANARGLKLEVGDILKGVLAEQVRNNNGTVAQVDACAQAFRSAQQKLRAGFTDFLHATEIYVLREEHQEVQYLGHTTGEKLEGMFNDSTPPGEIVQWLEGDFSRIARIFARSREHLHMDPIKGVDISFRQLSFLSWKEWQPLLVAMGLSYDNMSAPGFAQEVKTLCRICYIVELLEMSASARRRKFIEAMRQRERGLNPFIWDRRANGPRALYFAKGTALRRAMKALRAPLVSEEKRGAVVRWIETLLWSGEVPRQCTDDASVEHVLPKASVGAWQTLFSEEERDASLNLLGNLCLIDKSTNIFLGNKEWDFKKSEYLKKADIFKGLGQVLDVSAQMALQNDPRPWSARTVAQLTERLARIGDQALRP
ncbi:MAG: DUF262 domain-containing HNH endonuclease family protein [Hyphomicrobiaceae bacterium]|nr:DUF262 domain-containing HNH endonuclease family protein [Hyphomicrobiaceae bacterium]